MKFEILERTELAVRAVRLLADLSRAPSHELAERLGTSGGFLTQVLSPLVQRGVLISTRGPGGGYRFAVPPSTLTMLDIIEIIEGPTEDGRCVLEDAECPRIEPCSLHDAWIAARTSLTETLGRTPVLDTDTEETPR